MLGFLVHTLDAGRSVMFHAADMEHINSVNRMIERIVGPAGRA